jgi:hypothetical protein
MTARLNLAGRRSGKLLFIRPVVRHGRRLWLCRCDCGNTTFQTARTKMLVNGCSECKGRPNLVGQRFGKLIVTSFYKAIDRNAIWLCRCDCGKNKKASTHDLRRGTTSHCGCSRKATHGVFSHHQSATPEYFSWVAMRKRCLNPRDHNYPRYGGRGIKICVRWSGKYGFRNFLTDMGLRPKGTSLDRFPNNNGNYEKSNCRWATPKEQSNNRRNNVNLPARLVRKRRRDGETLDSLAHEFNASRSTIHRLLSSPCE